MQFAAGRVWPKALAALIACVLLAPAVSAPRIAPWGFDLAGMDRSVKPGDDFARYAGGTWMRDTTIPPDRASWGPFFELRAKAEADVKAIVDEVASQPHPAGSIEQKISDTYTSYLDAAAIESAGMAPMLADLSSIRAVRSHADVARLMGRPDLGVGGPLSLSPWPDAANPDRYAINIVQSGLILPDRDYYLEDDPKFVEVRKKYRVYVEAMLALGHYPEPGHAADKVVALETEIARLQWSRAKRGDRDLTYHPKVPSGTESVCSRLSLGCRAWRAGDSPPGFLRRQGGRSDQAPDAAVPGNAGRDMAGLHDLPLFQRHG